MGYYMTDFIYNGEVLMSCHTLGLKESDKQVWIDVLAEDYGIPYDEIKTRVRKLTPYKKEALV